MNPEFMRAIRRERSAAFDAVAGTPEIPLVDLLAQYRSISRYIDKAIESVIEASAFIGGQRVQQFEQKFADKLAVSHCVGVANGTDALYIAMKMLQIGPGDEVITVANSWISTSESITQTGAKPVFVDIDEYFNIDVDKIERAITGRTRAVIPVHLYGQAADMSAIRAICDRYGLEIIEDCAQAHLAQWKERKVGTFGRAGTFSFYPGKNLGAYGDAGAIVTEDSEFAEKCRRYANHGALRKHEHTVEGVNSRLDGIQAAILSAKLQFLEQWTARRQEIAAIYHSALNDIDEIECPGVGPDRTHVFHLYVVRAARRDELRSFLAGLGIRTGIHYPKALPFLAAYRYLGHRAEDFPRACANQDRILSLPMYPELDEGQLSRVIGAVREFYGRSGTSHDTPSRHHQYS